MKTHRHTQKKNPTTQDPVESDIWSVSAQFPSRLSLRHSANTTFIFRKNEMNHTLLDKYKLAAVLSRRVSGRTHLNISRQRKVLPEGVTLETVVCENTPQVWVVGKEHAKHVPYLHRHTHFYFLCGHSVTSLTFTLHTFPLWLLIHFNIFHHFYTAPLEKCDNLSNLTNLRDYKPTTILTFDHNTVKMWEQLLSKA